MAMYEVKILAGKSGTPHPFESQFLFIKEKTRELFEGDFGSTLYRIGRFTKIIRYFWSICTIWVVLMFLCMKFQKYRFNKVFGVVKKGCKQKVTRVSTDVFGTYLKIVQKYCNKNATKLNTVVIDTYSESTKIPVNKMLHFADFLIEARI